MSSLYCAQDTQQIVVRTSNKKYFKRISIEDMERAKLRLSGGALSWGHENATLIIQYKKPAAVLQVRPVLTALLWRAMRRGAATCRSSRHVSQLEKEAKEARLNAKDDVPTAPGGKEGDVDCKSQ